jgi:flavin-dependent dehydrogenase
MPTTTDRHHEVIVVGARAAGASTAMLLARMGHDVALVDKARFPSDTLSTHALSRGGVVSLKRWGLLDDVLATGAPAVRQVTFGTAEGELTRTIKLTAGVDILLAPRRLWLDALLADAAKRAGAELYLQTTVRDLIRDADGRVTGVATTHPTCEEARLTADLLIIADGVRSGLARAVGARSLTESISPSGTFYGYVDGLDDRGFEFHLAPRAMAGVFRTHDDQACVWISSPTAESRPLLSAGADRPAALTASIAAAAPELGDRLRRTSWASPIRGAINLPNVVRQPYGRGWALVATPAITAIRSPATASPTPSATLSCWPGRSTRT